MNSIALSLVALIIAILSPLISLLMLQFHRKRVKAHYDWEKKVQALSYSITRNERIKNARLKLAEKFNVGERDSEISYADVESANTHVPEIKPHITDILGHWENMCLAIEREIVDEDVAFEMVGSTVITYTFVFQQFIENRRKVNPRAYLYLVKVAKEWQKERIPAGESVSAHNMKIRLK